MIVPMKKFYLIVLDKDRESAPERLRKLGVAHVEELQGSGETYQTLEQKKADAENVYYFLSNYVEKESKSKRQAFASLEDAKALIDVLSLIKEISDLKRDFDSIAENTAQLAREIERVSSWGEIFESQIEYIGEKTQLSIKLYETYNAELKNLPEEIQYIRIAAPKGKARIAVVTEQGQEPQGLSASFQEFMPPQRPLSMLREELEAIAHRMKNIEAKFRSRSKYLPLIKAFIDDVESDIILERLRSGMLAHEQFAYLMGYVPARDAEKLKQIAQKYGWAVALEDPSSEDKPPTLVENPPAVRIIKPVFDFLGIVPNYNEYEISFWFLIFFVLFSAMIFGDGGYGLVITLGAFFSIFKARSNGKKVSDAQKLFAVLGFATVLWGALTGSWFGIAYNYLPSILRNISLPWINGQSPDSENNIKALCFLIGFIQLSIAHIKNLKRDFPNPKFLSQIGSLFLLAGMLNLSLNLVVDSKRFPIENGAVLSIGIGFVLVFVFGNWTGRFGSSILESLKGIISIFLGTVSVFADIVSYIRLWAVGLAGLAISQTVNGMASGILGGGFAAFVVGFIIKALLAVTLLVASHSLNFVMTVLSILVHGIRLNMLEFSGHLGMEWSGYKYQPLKEKDTPSASVK
ncbi:MAG: V-type ATP synthase subunit I [Rectinema subterraneum]|uniref:V-type ATP synthase subunit I n=1 Tax=Rectinema subterraneum TaxID=2653714 RepID=UPI003C7D6BC9